MLDFFSSIGTPDLPSSVALFNMVTDLKMRDDDSLAVQVRTSERCNSLTFQVEQFSVENRAVTLRNDKQAPADMDLRLYGSICIQYSINVFRYNSEKPKRGPSPAREYN